MSIRFVIAFDLKKFRISLLIKPKLLRRSPGIRATPGESPNLLAGGNQGFSKDFLKPLLSAPVVQVDFIGFHLMENPVNGASCLMTERLQTS